MKVSGIKATGFSRGLRGRSPEVEMASGSETVTRHGTAVEYSVTLRGNAGDVRLTLDEVEMRDWHMRLGRALATLEVRRIDPPEDVGGGIVRDAEISDGTGASSYRLREPTDAPRFKPEPARICCGCGAKVSQSQAHSQGCLEAKKPESQRESRWADPGEV